MDKIPGFNYVNYVCFQLFHYSYSLLLLFHHHSKEMLPLLLYITMQEPHPACIAHMENILLKIPGGNAAFYVYLEELICKKNVFLHLYFICLLQSLSWPVNILLK